MGRPAIGLTNVKLWLQLLGGGSEQCLALPQVAGRTDPVVEGDGSPELCVGLGPTAGGD
jgi:hypothetical protein